MAKLAIIYATTEGQTAKIAHHIANRARSAGHEAEVHHVDALDELFDPARYHGVIIGGSIHEGRYQRYLERWLRAQNERLSCVPTALFTVCLAIHSEHEEERTEALRFPAGLTERTEFVPDDSAVFAGALKYTQYNWLKRALMKQIAKREGGATDTSIDHEYTDWAEVDAFADRMTARIDRPSPARASTGAIPAGQSG